MSKVASLRGAVAASALRRRASVVMAACARCRTYRAVHTLSALASAQLAPKRPAFDSLYLTKPLQMPRSTFATMAPKLQGAHDKGISASSNSPAPRKTKRTNTVILGPLPHEMDEAELSGMLSACGELVHVRIRRDANTGASLGYGYAKFSSTQSVDMALTLDGTVVGNETICVRALVQHLDEVHVRGLSWDVDEERLGAFFKRCGKIVSVAIRSSAHARQSTEVHGFVQFELPKSASRALQLDGMRLLGRPLTVRLVVPRSKYVINQAKLGDYQASKSVLVSHLPPQANDDWLQTTFGSCGEIVAAQIQRHFGTADSPGTRNSLGFGYVHFASPSSVEKALRMHGQTVAGHIIQVRPSSGRPYDPDVWSRPARNESDYSENTIWIKKLANGVDENRLQREFERFGKVVKANVPRDRHREYRLRDYGFVTFASREAMEKAISNTSKMTIDGFAVKIARSLRSQTPMSESGDSIVQSRV